MAVSAYSLNFKIRLFLTASVVFFCIIVGTILFPHFIKFCSVAKWGIQVITFRYRNLESEVNIIHLNSAKSTSTLKRTFKIFYWTSEWKGRSWFGEGTDPFKYCSHSNCLATTEMGEYNSSDAVLFSMSFIHLEHKIPTQKFSHQKWIMHTYEAPPQDLRWNNFYNFDGLFNATWTYHRDSELLISYGPKVVRRKEPNNKYLPQLHTKTRSKLIAWFVTKCRDPVGKHSKRLAYVRNLEKFIPVDIYGPCGRYRCGRTQHLSRVNELNECDEMLRNNYKFYLAFENSICQDYVTEKVWRAVFTGVIPVVLGGADYSKILPPHSYIDIKDFRSPEKLADYLYLLDRDESLYNSYFKWHSDYELVENVPDQCKLCEYMNQSANKTKVYDHLGKFWSLENMCTAPEEFFTNVDPSSWQFMSARKTYLEML